MKRTEAVKATGFILTKEYGRFAEFADSCSEFGYIGICHGEPSVCKSLAAAYYSKWDEEIGRENAVNPVSPALNKKLKSCRGVLLSAPVINTPKIIEKTVSYRLDGYTGSQDQQYQQHLVATQGNALQRASNRCYCLR
ncbi:hypothetical protein ACFSKU_03640 [Pontibacter silvestris]|uniref:Uncharacterized protein n=1 Tax=Pontibacter silvestris TaxID=2305183 RepID=A0ABW4WUW9_9BACT|nr:hypothetical protein [Pontibacter silvestris]MCC9138046.1 hypothetical protein [Pontibacter silvestris]